MKLIINEWQDSLLLPMIVLPCLALVPITTIYYVRKSNGGGDCSAYDDTSNAEISTYLCCQPEYYIGLSCLSATGVFGIAASAQVSELVGLLFPDYVGISALVPCSTHASTCRALMIIMSLSLIGVAIFNLCHHKAVHVACASIFFFTSGIFMIIYSLPFIVHDESGNALFVDMPGFMPLIEEEDEDDIDDKSKLDEKQSLGTAEQSVLDTVLNTPTVISHAVGVKPPWHKKSIVQRCLKTWYRFWAWLKLFSRSGSGRICLFVLYFTLLPIMIVLYVVIGNGRLECEWSAVLCIAIQMAVCHVDLMEGIPDVDGEIGPSLVISRSFTESTANEVTDFVSPLVSERMKDLNKNNDFMRSDFHQQLMDRDYHSATYHDEGGRGGYHPSSLLPSPQETFQLSPRPALGRNDSFPSSLSNKLRRDSDASMMSMVSDITCSSTGRVSPERGSMREHSGSFHNYELSGNGRLERANSLTFLERSASFTKGTVVIQRKMSKSSSKTSFDDWPQGMLPVLDEIEDDPSVQYQNNVHSSEQHKLKQSKHDKNDEDGGGDDDDDDDEAVEEDAESRMQRISAQIKRYEEENALISQMISEEDKRISEEVNNQIISEANKLRESQNRLSQEHDEFEENKENKEEEVMVV